MSKPTIEQFLKTLHEQNFNEKNVENDYDDVFGRNGKFSIICNKCGGVNIDIIGEGLEQYGEQTGCSPGHLAIKCNGCGIAETIYF